MGRRHPQTRRRGPGRTHSGMLWSSSLLDQERLGLLLKLLCCQLLLKPPSLWYFCLKPERICFHSVLQENKPEPECMAPVCVRWQSGSSLQVPVSGDSCEVKGKGHLDQEQASRLGVSIWIGGQVSASGANIWIKGKHLDQGQASGSGTNIWLMGKRLVLGASIWIGGKHPDQGPFKVPAMCGEKESMT